MKTRILGERLPQVNKQVRRVLKAYGNSHRPRLYPCRGQLHCTHPVVGCVDREHNERFDSSQTRRQKENPGPVAEPPRGSQAALEVKCQHAPKATHLPPGKAMVGM